jgi:cellulose synthase/poly-beta-1,6-N-acetylglucosamine synthase-like glycosyltransferase
MMTGSHYAVRTSALKEIGGIGPELDEDMTTTVMMNSRGKKGVYAGNAIAYGEGPLCLEDAQKQELQWAKSAVISFFRWRHVLIPKDSRMPAGGIIRFFMVRTWYTIQLAFSLYMWVFIAPLVFMNKWCSTTDKCTLSFTNLVIHVTPLLFANWGYEFMARKADWLRPSNTPFFSVDLIAYRILRPLWTTIGIMAGIFELIFNVVPRFSVTRKGDSNISPLGVFSMWYILLIMAYYGAFMIIKISLNHDIPITLVFLYAMIVVVYIYIVFRHFADQKFKALSIWNYVGHIAIICVLVGSIIAACIIFREDILVASSVNFFVPRFTYTYDMWLTIATNGLSILWMLILFLV